METLRWVESGKRLLLLDAMMDSLPHGSAITAFHVLDTYTQPNTQVLSLILNS